MSLSRRDFLAASPLVIGAVLPVKGLAFASGADGKRISGSADEDRLSALTWDSFYPYITTNFTFRSESGTPIELTLTKMTDTRPEGYVPTGEGEECFALTFKGPVRRELAQNVYAVEHFALGQFNLLITVVGKARRGVLYEAVINRITG